MPEKGSNMEKNEPNPGTIDEYIALFPSNIQEILGRIRKIVHECAPEAGEAIKYRMPTFVLNGNLVHFAAFKNHIGFYPTPQGIEEFDRELSKYEQGRGSVQFPLDKPIPYDLIKRIVEFRVEGNRAKAAAKGKKTKKQG